MLQVATVQKKQRERGDQRSIYFRIDASTVVPILKGEGSLNPEATDRDEVAAQAAALQTLYLVALHNLGLLDQPRAKWLVEDIGFRLRGGSGNLPMNAALAVALAAVRQIEEVAEIVNTIDEKAEQEGWKQAVKFVSDLEPII